MSKVSNMKLKDIINMTNLMVSEQEIVNFCDYEDIRNEFITLCVKSNYNISAIKQYLIQHEDKIDKERLVFNIYVNLIESLEQMEKNIEELNRKKNGIFKIDDKDNQYLDKLLRENRLEKKYLENSRKLLKDVDVYIAKAYKEKTKIRVEIKSSKEMIRERREPEKRKLAKIEKIDNELSQDKDGMMYIIQALMLPDLCALMQSEIIGMEVREAVLDNVIMRKEKMEYETLDKIKLRNIEQYQELINEIKVEDYLPDFREVIIKNIRFIDFDKLLLLCSYRLEEYLESGLYQEENIETVEYLVKYIDDEIENKKIKFKEVLEEKATGELKEVEYSRKDVEKFIQRLLGEKYISKAEIAEIKQDLIQGKIKFSEIDVNILNLLELTTKELDIIGNNCIENRAFIIELLEYTEEDILELLNKQEEIDKDLILYLIETKKISANSIVNLYYENKIDAEFFKEFSEVIDISSEINLQTINKLYNKIKSSKEENQEDITKLEKQIKLYKNLNLEGKNKEELQEESNNLMYEIAEDFNDEKDIVFYYKKGLLTLDTVAEWGGDSLIENLYNEEKIELKDIEELYTEGQIKQKTIEKIILSNKDLDEAELMAYVYLGYISDENVVKIFEEKNLHSTYATNLYEAGIISKQAEEKVRSRDIRKLEKRSGSPIRNLDKLDEDLEVAEGIGISFTTNKTKAEIRNTSKKDEGKDAISKDTTYHVGKTHSTKIINPFIRYEYLKALKCRRPERLEIDEDSPFYNYDFYVIQEECYGPELQRNAVIIAERFYEDKYNKEEFATMNATYIMNYEDYLVLQGKQKEIPNAQKREMIKEIDGAVYVVNHRSGSWASSMLYKIAQAKAGMSFKNYTGDAKRRQVIDWLRTLYTEEELDEILNLGIEIDNEDYTYEEKNGQLIQTSKLEEGMDWPDEDER